MAKFTAQRGETNRTLRVFVQDSSSTTGAGLTGLTYDSSDLVAYFAREGDTSPTQIVLVDASPGIFTSGGFKEYAQSEMPGWYELGAPDTMFDVSDSIRTTAFDLHGAPNMVPVPGEIEFGGIVEPSDVEDAVWEAKKLVNTCFKT